MIKQYKINYKVDYDKNAFDNQYDSDTIFINAEDAFFAREIAKKKILFEESKFGAENVELYIDKIFRPSKKVKIDNCNLFYLDEIIKKTELIILNKISKREIIDNSRKYYDPILRRDVVNAIIKLCKDSNLKEKIVQKLSK